MNKPGIALTVAGSDPAGGAGMQSDLKTFHSMGVYGLSVVSALTSQNTEGVQGILEVPPAFFSSQLDVLLKDVKPDAMKTGMLYSGDNVRILTDKIKEYSLQNIVIDPVSVSSTGVSLEEEGLLETLKDSLFPLSKVITPNIYEASVLTGIKIENEEDMKKAAVKLRESGPESVIITGGHLTDKAIDLLFDGKEYLTAENELLHGEFHGTGCVFSAALTASLALGYGVKEAFVKAKDFVFHAMKNAISIGKGMKILRI
jgi:hydroxymethylpyrimidine kinase/phosphomethylpyrimidine kinase